MRLDDDIERLFTTVPLLAATRRSDWRISPLGGITNRSYRLQATERDLVLRWPGASASRYLDRSAEPANAQSVADIGLAPPVLAADPVAGWYITEFVTGALALDAANLGDARTFGDVIGLLTKLHRSALVFPFRQGLFQAVDLYIGLAPTPLMVECRHTLESARIALRRNPMPLAACHIDPNPANFLRGEDGRLWLIDWEFAAMEEPLWDLAAVTGEAGLAGEDARSRIEPLIGAAQWPRFELYRTIMNLVAASWCEAELGAGNQSPDLIALRDDRVARLRERLALPQHAQWVAEA